MGKRIALFDTTLRDGEQGEGISFTVEDKIKIAHLLDSLGVDFIEGGWPGSNPKAIDFFKAMKKEKLKHARLAAFGSTCRHGKPAREDKNLNMLIESGAPVAVIFGKTWDMHVTDALKISLNENIILIDESVRFLKSHRRTVIFDAEHFFDGYRHNQAYALEAVTAAQNAGADMVVLCETNGGMLFDDVMSATKTVVDTLHIPVGIHAHNDSDSAVANSIAAVLAGAVQVQGTVNGYGERCGNANLCSIIPNLQLKRGYSIVSEKQLRTLTSVAHHISEIANRTPNNQQPFVGHSAFAHKAGIHVSAIQKNRLTYEHIDPASVGNKQRVLVSELSGISNLLYKAKGMNLDLDKDDPLVKDILARIKAMEHAGYQFEEAEASFEVMVRKALGKHRPLFELISFHVTNEKFGIDDMSVEATVKIRIKGREVHTVADGNGPVAALDRALRKALCDDYPQIASISLSDYRVRVLDSKDGTNAKVRVIIESHDANDLWGTVGVSNDIIEASWQALVDSIEYKLV
ncbi:MAG: citramalate synthase [Spirochaetes bacterium]|nr:citramalate synthase [Spirochaetota bacterium]